MPYRYAGGMTQLVTRIDDELAQEVDGLVQTGVARSRSDAVRMALRALVDRHRRANVAADIIRGYQERPQTEDEIGWSDAATAAMIAEEPW